MAPRPLTRLRKLCLAFPESTEVIAWGEPTFRVRNKIFAMYAPAGDHHGFGRPSAWCKAAAINQQYLVEQAPNQYFVPPYVGTRGWIGVYLDGDVDWAEVKELLQDAWELAAMRAGKKRKKRPAASQR